VGRFTEKQLVLITIAVAVLLTAGFGSLIWLDLQAIHKNEITDEDAAAAEVTDAEQWGEIRKMQEIKRQMEVAQAEADLIPKREIDVIVNREIVNRDAQILPEIDDVNNLARTINDFAEQAGVTLTKIGDLSINVGGEAIKTMPVQLSLSGSFDQFLKFLNLFENVDRIINTRSFSLQGGKVVGQGRDRRAIHDIRLDLVTYIYSPSVGLQKPVDIANYDRRKDDPAIGKLVRQQKPARVDKYALKQRVNRRDPLIDARRPGKDSPEAGDPADVQKQRDLLDRLKFDLQVLKADALQYEQFLQDKKYVALVGAKPAIDAKCAKLDAEVAEAEQTLTVAELHESFRDDVVTPFEKVKEKLGRVEVPRVLSHEQATKFLDQMKTGFDAREYEKVVKVLKDFDHAFKAEAVAEDATDIVGEMRALERDAQGMIAFSALRIKVTGKVLRPAGGSVVILQCGEKAAARSRKVGEFVDPANRCKLKEIHEDKLVFELDGLEIEHKYANK
jgi:Tfp pilus assembly protein PilO